MTNTDKRPLRLLDKQVSVTAEHAFNNEAQYQELAQTIANQAQAIVDGKIQPTQRYAQAKRLKDNVSTLLAWSVKP